jgi:hypothetical protein
VKRPVKRAPLDPSVDRVNAFRGSAIALYLLRADRFASERHWIRLYSSSRNKQCEASRVLFDEDSLRSQVRRKCRVRPLPGPSIRANDSLTMPTSGAPGKSSAEKGRPLRIRIGIVEK